ncbi:MAG: hypothetical protein IRY93_11560 [Chthoniobacterales bacterium]|nr:hypothetical protein [Chthoniobacterales bacterium]
MPHLHLDEKRSPARLSIRLNPNNPDHHLWNNNGTWFVHYTVHRPDFTKHRVRLSLGTASRALARARRDRHFAELFQRYHFGPRREVTFQPRSQTNEESIQKGTAS